ncbi:sigma factor AlgU negative regulatory protein [Cellvibrio zantedeschiae]|uniref:Sigma factor AlgU negative regulatory protein n=1 Tax=Cellvibrio zantedeschiae TaxID=1237077 RepID=A0ABQ3B159_9GAMM|nr:sigma-E factor negative regulatory protein [Cellvibrio zantedeschiae]GGY73714.1 sigma factor AlgU negative regulatory protein [Cellvibrio zantedeschiae]
MSEQNRPQVLAESISALMDNQASELELQRILKASEQDAEVKATWSRYQIASAVLRGEQAPIVMSDFAARISAAIDEEDALVEQPAPVIATKPQQGWRYQLGRVALVASVAGGMILGVGELNVATVAPQIASNTVVTPAQAPVDNTVSLPSGINSPMLNTRTVAVQTGYETRPQENRRVTFQPRQANSVVSDEEVSRYVNQMINAHSDNAAMNSGQGVLPYARVIITDEE